MWQQLTALHARRSLFAGHLQQFSARQRRSHFLSRSSFSATLSELRICEGSPQLGVLVFEQTKPVELRNVHAAVFGFQL